MRLVLGTRGSELARRQTAMVEMALRAAAPEVEIVVEVIVTSGDGNTPAGGSRHGWKGMFTGEIERALLAKRIDVAVHSAKDLPSEVTAGLEVCGALARAAIEDVLVSKGGAGMAALPVEATIATGSVRRQHQLRWLRPDLNVIALRGNVPTRLRKLTDNPWHGIVLARAGLERLGYDCAGGQLVMDGYALRTAILPMEEFLPAGGQGIVALQVRADDEAARRGLALVNDEKTFVCLRAEREFLRLLQGDCGTPVGVIATQRDGVMTMRAQWFDGQGAPPRVASARSDGAEEPEALAARLLELIHGK